MNFKNVCQKDSNYNNETVLKNDNKNVEGPETHLVFKLFRLILKK